MSGVAITLYAAAFIDCGLLSAGSRILSLLVGFLELLTLIASTPVAVSLLTTLWSGSSIPSSVLVVFTAPAFLVLFLFGAQYSSWVLAMCGIVSSYWLMKYKLVFNDDDWIFQLVCLHAICWSLIEDRFEKKVFKVKKHLVSGETVNSQIHWQDVLASNSRRTFKAMDTTSLMKVLKTSTHSNGFSLHQKSVWRPFHRSRSRDFFKMTTRQRHNASYGIEALVVSTKFVNDACFICFYKGSRISLSNYIVTCFILGGQNKLWHPQMLCIAFSL